MRRHPNCEFLEFASMLPKFAVFMAVFRFMAVVSLLSSSRAEADEDPTVPQRPSTEGAAQKSVATRPSQIYCDEEKTALTAFLKENDMPWDHWWAGRRREFSKTLNINSYPTIYVLGHEGVSRFKNIRAQELEEAVDSLLAELK